MKKVSIISVFYNEEKYIKEFLESILNQTYENIELICIDDGSTDGSKDVVMKYMNMFRQKGMNLRYYYQDNQGQAAATNFALKKIEGEYLCWIDADDYLYPDSVYTRVMFLEEHVEYGMVASDFHILYEENYGRRIEKKSSLYGKLNYQGDQFELAISGETIIENLAYMIRVDCLKRVNPAMEIATCKEGQNYQILLPMMYYYKRGFVNVALGCYRIHNDSHCHRKRNYDEMINRYDNLIKMLGDILNSFGIDDERILHIIKRSTFYMEKRKVIESDG